MDMMPWSVYAIRKATGFSRSGVMKLLAQRRLERFHIHGDAKGRPILFTSESVVRLLNSDEIDARKRTKRSEYTTLADLKRAAAKRSKT